MKLNKQKITNFLVIALGNLFLAFGVSIFILPHGIVNGGTSGVAIIVEKVFGINPEIIIFILCWALFFAGLVILGKAFALKTLLSTFIYPMFVSMFTSLNYFKEMMLQVKDPLLASLAGAVSIGVGMGVVYRCGASTGGFDVISLVLKKFFKIKLSISTFVMDAIVIALGLVSVSLQSALYGVICILLVAYMIEKITISGTSSYMAHIISDKNKEINDYLNNVLERGTTLIKAEGGMTGNDKVIIEVVFNEKEYYDIRKNIYLIDDKAFLSIYRTINTYGNGFEEIFARRK